MGLFSKQTYTCALCGQQVTKREKEYGTYVCPDCLKKYQVENYHLYNSSIGDYVDPVKYYPEYANHWKNVFDKYRIDGLTSLNELHRAGENYKDLTEKEAEDILLRSQDALVTVLNGDVIGPGFAIQNSKSVVVDFDDVFAVALHRNADFSSTSQETIEVGLFTNDPFAPVICILGAGEIGFFSFSSKSKSGRRTLERAFTTLCPNLQYPIQDIKKFKKQIINEGSVRGNIPYDKMLYFTDVMKDNVGPFYLDKYMNLETNTLTRFMLHYGGFYTEQEFNDALHLDKHFPRRFWEKTAKRINSR